MTRAVVLAGGGVGGIAWLIGMIAALGDLGVDVASADTLIGTSAGAAVAAQVATGQLDAAIAAQLDEHTAEIAVEFDMPAFLANMVEAASEATSRTDAARRIANVPTRNPEVGEAQRRAVIAARLPVHDWPARPLLITAVAKATGQRAVFTKSSGVDLVSAVAASCAVPGMWPATTIGGAEYVDGGVHSSSNADLAAGSDATLLLVPSAIDDNLASLIAEEQTALAPGRQQLVAADDESLAAIGPNALDPSRRALAYAAGRTQAARVVDEVRTLFA